MRYFPVLHPMPLSEEHYRAIVRAALPGENGQKKKWDEFVKTCFRTVKPEGEGITYGGHANAWVKIKDDYPPVPGAVLRLVDLKGEVHDFVFVDEPNDDFEGIPVRGYPFSKSEEVVDALRSAINKSNLFKANKSRKEKNVIVVRQLGGGSEGDTEVSFTGNWVEEIDGFKGGAEKSSYIEKMLGNMVRCGVIKRNNDSLVEPWPTAEKWVKGNEKIGFDKFILYSIIRGWAAMNLYPMGIEALRDILEVFSFNKKRKSLRIVEIGYGLVEEDESWTEGQKAAARSIRGSKDYEKNSQHTWLTEMLRLLEFMGAIRHEENGPYSKSWDFSYVRDYLRRWDVFYNVERILIREGANTETFTEKALSDFSKYYIYREARGYHPSKASKLLDTIHKEYLLKSTRKGKWTEPKLYKNPKMAGKKAKKIGEVIKKFPVFAKKELEKVPINVLQRMLTARDQTEATTIKASGLGKLSKIDLITLGRAGPSYELPPPPGFRLYKWQKEAVNHWFNGTGICKHEKERGIIEVVTGAGKTVMALEAIRRWIKKHPKGVVSVVVPTKVLMYQWLMELRNKLNVPSEEVGWVGDNNKESFLEGKRILVLVVNSAIREDFLKKMIKGIENGSKHFMVADECHRYTAEKFSKVFDCEPESRIGLSATPVDIQESDTEDEGMEEVKADIQELIGPIFFNFNYADARKENLIPEFEMRYVGVDFEPYERMKYDALTKRLGKTLRKIETFYGNRIRRMKGGSLDQKLHVILKSDRGYQKPILDYFKLVRERREVVNEAVQRQNCTLTLLKEALEEERKTIVFQERISQLEGMVRWESRGRDPITMEYTDSAPERALKYEKMPWLKTIDQDLERLFDKPKYKPVMYHSGHRRRGHWNRFAMDWFSDGSNMGANVMLSVKALIEGVDVPGAQMGIIRVSTSSLRQRIQTIGRVLRKADQKEKSYLYIIFVRNSIDERLIFEIKRKGLLGMAKISYKIWKTTVTDDPKQEGRQMSAGKFVDGGELPRPRKCINEEKVVDVSKLKPGDRYEGEYSGKEYGVDYKGSVFIWTREGRRYLEGKELDEPAKLVLSLKGGGKMAVNEEGHILTKVKGIGIVFLGVIQEPDFKPELSKRKRRRLTEKAPTFEELFGMAS